MMNLTLAQQSFAIMFWQKYNRAVLSSPEAFRRQMQNFRFQKRRFLTPFEMTCVTSATILALGALSRDLFFSWLHVPERF